MSDFIFDVDGTLTVARQKINDSFGKFFSLFCNDHNVYLVTGSDREKTVEQLGIEIYNKCKRVYQCSGNETWIQDNIITKNNWKITENALAWLLEELRKSEFPLRTGRHIEHRSGMVNFTILGRNATLSERQLYIEWDKRTNERKILADAFNSVFKDLEATVGGDTGLDISQRGMDKSQILKDFDITPFNTLHFFGDATFPGGNDYTISEKVKELAGFSYDIKGWEDTWNTLKKLV